MSLSSFKEDAMSIANSIKSIIEKVLPECNLSQNIETGFGGVYWIDSVINSKIQISIRESMTAWGAHKPGYSILYYTNGKKILKKRYEYLTIKNLLRGLESHLIAVKKYIA